MLRSALIAAAVAGLASSASYGALVIQLNAVTIPATSAGASPHVNSSTSTNVDSSAFDVYYITAVETTGTPVTVQAASLVTSSGTPATGNGTFQFSNGTTANVGGGTSAANITSRSKPDSTFFFLPSATATVGTNVDDPINGFDNGVSKNFSIQTFRSGAAYTATTSSLILGALVVDKGHTFTMTGVVNGTLDPVNNVPFYFSNVPEPTTLAAVGMAALGLVRRRK